MFSALRPCSLHEDRPAAAAAGFASALSLFFLYLELLKTYRSSQWSGMGTSEVLGVFLGLAAYGLLFLALIVTIRFLLDRILRRRLRTNPATAAAAAIAGALVWTVLSQYREITPTADDALVLAGVLGLCGGAIAVPALRILPANRWRACANITMGGGLSALISAGYFFLFDDHREQAVTFYPAAWMAACGILGLVPWIYGRRYAVLFRAIHGLAAIAIPILITAYATYSPPRDPADTRPNLVLMIADAMHADRLNIYNGPAPSPNLDALAKHSTVFDQCYSLAPWTMPSVSALFAGDYPPSLTPNATGEQWLSQIWMYNVPEARPTLAKQLQAKGYATAALTANALLWFMPGLMTGFETTAKSHPVLLQQEGLFSHLPFLQAALSAYCPACDALRPHNTTAAITRYAKAWLRRHRNQPFFLWVHYMDPHAPCDPPERFRTMQGPWPFFYPYKGGERWGIPILGPDFTIPADAQPYMRSLYDGEASYIDEQVGLLLKRLDSLGLRKNTIFCFTADHGEELWEHADWGHGQSVYNEQLHVPLLISGPGILPRRIPQPLSAIDLMPTLAEITGTPPPQQWKGRSLATVLRGADMPQPAPPIFAQGTSNRCWPSPQQAVIDNEWKLIRETGTNTLRLYRLTQDPGEKNNLAAQYPQETARLEALLRGWQSTFVYEFPSGIPATSPDSSREEIMENLRGMGYLQ